MHMCTYPKIKERNWNIKIKKCILVGTMTLLRLIDYTVIISKDVMFDENYPLHNIRGKKDLLIAKLIQQTISNIHIKSTKLKEPNESI